jgi:putative ABC transport system permease protein
VLVQPIGSISNITGIHLDEFNRMSGGFKYLSGGGFSAPNDLIVDEIFARQDHLRIGDTVNLGRNWRVCGIVEPGKMSRTFADISTVQEFYSATKKVTIIWVKADKPENINATIDALKQRLEGYSVLSVDEYTSLLSANNIPMLKDFTGVVIGLGVAIGFLVVFLSMYMAVLERTREIGILKALGASPHYILGILLRETTLLAIVGAIAGILMTYGSRALLATFKPEFKTVIVYHWWPIAALIALVGALVGALYPGFKAARQDAIEALSYD